MPTMASAAARLKSLLSDAVAKSGASLGSSVVFPVAIPPQLESCLVEIVAVWRPFQIDAAALDQVIFSKTLPYTLRAFNEPLDMPRDSPTVLEHRAHVFDGDLLMLLMRQKDANAGEESLECVGHAIWCVDPTEHICSHDASLSCLRGPPSRASAVWYLEGICTDPALHGRGLGQVLLLAALDSENVAAMQCAVGERASLAPPSLIALRTQNKIMAWMLHSVINKLEGATQTVNHCVYPQGLCDGTPSVSATAIADQLLKVYFSAKDAAQFDATRGVFVEIYGSKQTECFSGKRSAWSQPLAPGIVENPFASREQLGAAMDGLIDAARGDAFLLCFAISRR